MTVWCYGSINYDHIYEVSHLPAPGETVAAQAMRRGLGGKGANQSVAAARAGAEMRHIGAVGADGEEALAALAGAGVDCRAVARLDGPSGQAVIWLDAAGENSIVTHAGANGAIALDAVLAALDGVGLDDILLLQNEVPHARAVAEAALGLGMEVIYSAAPFDLAVLRDVLPFVGTLVVNEVEAAQLQAALGVAFEDLPVASVVITRGAEGARWLARGTATIDVPAFAVDVVDTTGAGDCFTGALAAALDAGQLPEEAMRFAVAAAALQVTRPGAAAAMPALEEIAALLGEGG